MVSKSNEEAKARITQTVDKVLRLDVDGRVPEILYHFTDASGLAGILTHQSLWASRARSLNDPSEVAYGLRLAKQRLQVASLAGPAIQLRDRVLAYLEGGIVNPDWNVLVEPYVTSFCAGADVPLHWLHYAQSGTGYALGLQSQLLAAPPFTLVDIIYEHERQIRVLDQAFEAFKEIVGRFGDQEKLIEASAVACTVATRAIAGRLKDPRFATEAEWRLISWALQGTHVHVTSETAPQPNSGFRASHGRVIPYIIRRFSTLPLSEVVLGYSTPQSDDDMRSILRIGGFENVTVARSSVPLR